MTEQDKMQSLYMITGMEKVKKYQIVQLAYLNYLKTSIKIGHKEKLMVRIKSRLKFRWISCLIFLSIIGIWKSYT